MIVVTQVPAQLVHQTWPSVETFFQMVAPHCTESFSVEQMRTEIFMSRWALFTATENGVVLGAMAMQYQNRINHRVAFILAAGGKGIANKETWAQLKRIFVENGATTVEASMRTSAYRLWRKLGFQSKYQVAGVTL